MIELLRTDSSHADFVMLVSALDAELALQNGDQHSFYHQFNGISMIRHAVVAYLEGKAVGCGAIKELAEDSMELKRMFTVPDFRGRGVASAVLAELERWATEMSYKRCMLETGLMQPKAIALYGRRGYVRIPNYGQYAGVENSICFEKRCLAEAELGKKQ
jgi:putative acetyltransferase